MHQPLWRPFEIPQSFTANACKWTLARRLVYGSATMRKLVIYLVVPAAVSLALILAYFSGASWLQSLVSPRIAGMHPDSSREFGLLENLQNLYLLGIVVVAACAVKLKTLRIEKAAFAALVLFSLFVFLEEIDYGLHYYEYWNGITFFQAAQTRNLHNIGDANKVLKTLVDATMVLLFVIAPLAFAKTRRPLLRYLTPDRYAILTMVAMFILSRFAHYLRDIGAGTPGTINKNISEFRELTVYYLCLVYLVNIVFYRRFAPAPTDNPPKATT